MTSTQKITFCFFFGKKKHFNECSLFYQWQLYLRPRKKGILTYPPLTSSTSPKNTKKNTKKLTKKRLPAKYKKKIKSTVGINFVLFFSNNRWISIDIRTSLYHKARHHVHLQKPGTVLSLQENEVDICISIRWLQIKRPEGLQGKYGVSVSVKLTILVNFNKKKTHKNKMYVYSTSIPQHSAWKQNVLKDTKRFSLN